MINNNLIIVSLTTWTKRIGNVYKTIDCFLKQTVTPDLIELNLSLKEFPNKEKDIPEILVSYANEKKININWVNGNTKAFKKIIPTVKKYYGKNYYLLSADDDCLYGNEYIKIMLDNFINSKCDYMSMRDTGMSSSRMIFNSSCFKPDFWENLEKLPKDIIDKSVDDAYYYRYLTKHGKKNKCFMPKNFKSIFSNHDDICGLHEMYRKPGYLDAVNKAMNKI